EDDFQTTIQKGMASTPVVKKTGCSKDKVLEQPEYWALLGRMVLKSRKARCFSCAAAAVYSLVMDPECDSLVIASVANESFDHHFVVVAKSEGDLKAGRAYAIDIWQANLDKSSYVQSLDTFRYTKGKTKVFCLLMPEERAGLRAWVETAGKVDDD
ncbi:MAG TPA: hypothetical protein VF625_06815, partial [Longimicrobium sp.]